MTAIFQEAYGQNAQQHASHRSLLISSLNPNKLVACEELMLAHERRGHRVLVFSDCVWTLQKVAELLGRQHLDGRTSNQDRNKYLEELRSGARKTLMLSKIGDTSIDIPEASVIIQICTQDGSRRQEAQRLGRILRAKPGGGGDGGGSAYFYSLVSAGTLEPERAERRQAYLAELGYVFEAKHFCEHTTGEALAGLDAAPGAPSAPSAPGAPRRLLSDDEQRKLLKEIPQKEIPQDAAG